VEEVVLVIGDRGMLRTNWDKSWDSDVEHHVAKRALSESSMIRLVHHDGAQGTTVWNQGFEGGAT
jgi:hypothetical protein